MNWGDKVTWKGKNAVFIHPVIGRSDAFILVEGEGAIARCVSMCDLEDI